MTDIAVPGSMPFGARQVGVRIKPGLRLAIGYRDEQKRGAPTKVDYFIPKRGTDGEFGRAADKFTEVYGEKPKAVEIRLPGEFGEALDIRYKAFAGGGDPDGGGGVMTAKGETNFALYDYVGGPDTLTVWRQDGTVVEVQTAGVDALTGEPLDEIARDLQLALYTTFRFGIPNVLAYGSHCEITSKGKTTTDTLWFKLRGLYGTFGSRTAWVVRPTLVVRPAHARPVIKDKEGNRRRIRSKIYVLDIITQETEDEMLGRLREYRELTESTAASLWGERPQLEAPWRGSEGESEGPVASPVADASSSDEEIGEVIAEEDEPTVAIVGLEEQTAGAHEDPQPLHSTGAAEEPEDSSPDNDPPPAPTSVPDPEPAFTLSSEERAFLPMASKMKPPMGSYQSHSLTRILEFGPSGREWLKWALRQPWPQDAEFRNALSVFCRAQVPDLLEEILREDAS